VRFFFCFLLCVELIIKEMPMDLHESTLIPFFEYPTTCGSPIEVETSALLPLSRKSSKGTVKSGQTSEGSRTVVGGGNQHQNEDLESENGMDTMTSMSMSRSRSIKRSNTGATISGQSTSRGRSTQKQQYQQPKSEKVLVYPVTVPGRPSEKDLVLVYENPAEDLFQMTAPMLLFLFGFLFPPLWIVGACAGWKSEDRRKRVWSNANALLGGFVFGLGVIILIWGLATNFNWK
jgi:hypothetical protein